MPADFFGGIPGLFVRLLMGIISFAALVGFLRVAWNLVRNQPSASWTTRYGRRY
jgi:hypothetical protein